jgi:hypothetical protein
MTLFSVGNSKFVNLVLTLKVDIYIWSPDRTQRQIEHRTGLYPGCACLLLGKAQLRFGVEPLQRLHPWF